MSTESGFAVQRGEDRGLRGKNYKIRQNILLFALKSINLKFLLNC